MRAPPLSGWGFAMDRVQWSLYAYSAFVIGAGCLAAAAALDSWQLTAAALAVMALGVIVLRLRDVEPAARDDRFAQIVSSPVARLSSVGALIGLWGLSLRRGGLWLVWPALPTALRFGVAGAGEALAKQSIGVASGWLFEMEMQPPELLKYRGCPSR